MTVRCPNCSTGYLLPDHLMGPRGARVRCPHCKRPFVVLRETSGDTAEGVEERSAEQEPLSIPSDAAPIDADVPGASDADASRVAQEVLDSLASSLGGALVQARSRGRILAEFGPDVMKAFDEYRARLGDRALPAAFRAALKERWGIDLAT